MTTATYTTRPPENAAAEPASDVPQLENGDVLDADEFMRRYEAHDEPVKAELIFGRVYVTPPVSGYGHGYQHGMLMTVLGVYMAGTRGVTVFDNSTARFSAKSVPQPDALMFIDPAYGGRATFNRMDYIQTGIDLVAEIARTSTNYDLHDKLDLYEQNKIPEYIVWRVVEHAFDYFILRDDKYVRHTADEAGIFRSEVYPGLWIDSKALLAGDLSAALKTLATGLASTQHSDFLKTLQPKA